MIKKAKRKAQSAKRPGLRKISVFLCLIFTLCAMCYTLCAYAEKIETKYFTVSLCEGCSLSSFAEKINATKLFRLDALSGKSSDIRSVIKEGIDSLFLEVCDALDVTLKGYRGSIVVYPDSVEVSKTIYSNSQIIEANLPSLYIPSHNTIYISFKDTTAGMLAHEMAHAAISTYFVTALPSKVQEILAGYSEYSIRKKTGSLPQK